MRTIIVDPGHGGDDWGASYDDLHLSFDGLREKDFNLAVGLFLRLLLVADGIPVGMTRETDLFVPLDVRAKSTRGAAAAFVSLHADAFEGGQARGFTVYYYHDNGRDLAQAICKSMSQMFPTMRNRGVKQGNYQVLRDNPGVPAVLVECGFVSTWTDREILRAPDSQYRHARAIATGIKQWANRTGVS